MKANILRRALSVFSTLVLFALLVAPSVSAAANATVVFQVPFDFIVAGKTLPAGRYVVVRSTLYSNEILSLRGLDQDEGVYALTSTVQSNGAVSDSKLVFTRYEGQYFLAEFWTSGEESGRRLVKSEKERALARNVARSGAKAERVAVISEQK
ncbi:MAG TPA: hypothetical protein VEV81_08540 [Pyrinomonadaceae bacterium]|nr:hypothetical protein [Pyrinomonadaceae bacterium]